MSLKRRQYLKLVGGTGLGISLAGCQGEDNGDGGNGSDGGGGDGSDGGGGDGPIQIGASIAQTGPYANTASYSLEAFRQWEQEVNQEDGLLGRDVEFVFYDDQSDPQQAVSLYRKLINDDNVDLMFGPFGSPVGKAVASIQEQAGYATIHPMTSDSSIWTENDYASVFQGIGIARNYIRDGVKIAAENGAETIAFAHPEASFPQAATNGGIEHAEDNGLEVLDRITYPQDGGNYSQIAADLASQEPDVVAGGGYFPDAEGLTRGLRATGYNADMYLFYTAVASSDFHDTLGSVANGISGNTAWDPNADTEGNQDFFESYQEMWDREPDYHSAGNYAAGQVLKKAVEDVGEINQDAIAENLRTENYESVFGTWGVTDEGVQEGYGHLIIQWQDGQKEIIAPEEAATADPIYPAPTWDEK